MLASADGQNIIEIVARVGPDDQLRHALAVIYLP
jgi:hypothetical protein